MDRTGIAERLRGLLGGPEDGNLGAMAERLGIEEVSLRMSIDEDSPHPTVEVLGAVIREFGVDPTWLLTGRYDPSTHRTAMENARGTLDALRQFVHPTTARIAEPPPENVHPHQQN